MRVAVLIAVLFVAACGNRAETIGSLPSSISDGLPSELKYCPVDKPKKPVTLPTIRTPEAVNANRDDWQQYGQAEDQAGRVCHANFRKSIEWFERRVAVLEALLQRKRK